MTSTAPLGVVFLATSSDGHLAEEDGSVAFLDEFNETLPDGGGFFAFLGSVQAMVMGRKTFDTVLGFPGEVWPYGELPVWVITTGENGEVQIPEWLDAKGTVKVTTVSSGGLPSLLSALQKKVPGVARVYVDGGATVRAFLEAGLVSEATITAVPLSLGRGIPCPLLEERHRPRLTQLGEALRFDNGCVQTKYRIARP